MIVITIYSLNNGGFEKSLFRFVNYLLNNKYDVKLIVTESKGEMYNDFNQLSLLNLSFIDNKVIKLYKLLKNKSITNIFNFCEKYTQAIIPFLPKKIKITSVIRTSDQYFINLMTSNDNYINNYICNSPQLKKNIKKKTIKKVYLIPNGIELVDNKRLNDNKPSLNFFSILFVGRFSREKGIDKLIDLATRLKFNNYNFKINIVGDGDLKNEIINEIHEKKLNSVVNILGYKKGDDLYNLYKENHFLFFSSIGEGLPNVLIESQYFGCVPISNLLEDITDFIILKNYTGIILEKNNKSYFDEIINCIENDKWQIYSQNGQNWIKTSFSNEIEEKKYLALLNDSKINLDSLKKRNIIYSIINFFKIIGFRYFIPKTIKKIRRIIINKQ